MTPPTLKRTRELLRTVGTNIIGAALIALAIHPTGYTPWYSLALILLGLITWLTGAINEGGDHDE